MQLFHVSDPSLTFILVQTLAGVVEDLDFEIGWGALYKLHCFTYLLIKKTKD